MSGAEHFVMAFRPDGNGRVRTPIFVGDYLEWKRNGQTGTCWMLVAKLSARGDGPSKVSCRPISGCYSSRARTITRGIHHVVSPDGFDRLSGQKRLLPFLQERT